MAAAVPSTITTKPVKPASKQTVQIGIATRNAALSPKNVPPPEAK